MPLSVLSNISREAPLGSLLVAFCWVLPSPVADDRWFCPAPGLKAPAAEGGQSQWRLPFDVTR
jgi:hypothetical protein